MEWMEMTTGIGWMNADESGGLIVLGSFEIASPIWMRYTAVLLFVLLLCFGFFTRHPIGHIFTSLHISMLFSEIGVCFGGIGIG
jgi:hypothetical protein